MGAAWLPAMDSSTPAAAEHSIPSSRAHATAALGAASAAEGAARGKQVVLQHSTAAVATCAPEGSVGRQLLQQSHTNCTAAAAAARLAASCAPADAASFPSSQPQCDAGLGCASQGYCAHFELPAASQVGAVLRCCLTLTTGWGLAVECQMEIIDRAPGGVGKCGLSCPKRG